MRIWAREKQEKKKLTDFRDTELLAFCGRLWGSTLKNDCKRGEPGVTGTHGNANNHFKPTQTGSGTAPPR